MKYTFYLLLLILVFQACVKSENEKVVLNDNAPFTGLLYGKIYIYEVDSIQYDTIQGKTIRDSVHFFMKESVIDTLRDLVKNKVLKIERSYRKKETQPWILKDIITANFEKQNFVRTEDGLKTLLLPYPLTEKKTFDPSVYVEKTFTSVEVKGEQIELYKGVKGKVTSLKATLTLYGKQYTNLCQIDWTNGTDNLAEQRLVKEYYAKDIGLIYRDLRMLNTQCLASCATQTWDKKAQSGFVWRMKLKGVE